VPFFVRGEAVCACGELGIEPPVFFGFNDREIDPDSTEPEAMTHLRALSDHVRDTIASLTPQVIVTWGPEGGYGHPDYRLVSDAVTEVVQSETPGPKVYYPEFSSEQARIVSRNPGAWPGVDRLLAGDDRLHSPRSRRRSPSGGMAQIAVPARRVGDH
jgi:LmbE family N-acetylglucosaminyl deacetylase